MAKILDKVIGIMGFADEEDDEELLEEEVSEKDAQDEPRSSSRKSAQVVSIHTQKQVKVVVIEPTSFDESQNIADQLKNRRPVIVNLENADHNLAKRIVDFVSGATYALGGNMQKVGQGIFLFVPNNVDISGESHETIKEKGFSWSLSSK
ncbi:cell division protein SepF [Desulfitobacterium metallireducens]|uniref:Cell division protein SepF n=1 Tax=Desulfitobacterium metallireducens DSM 15288 TaxID=871968 RepID=W0EF73_9FIRM|nr:cell division protein SepF [Desulfitobacterium metallireducens]AHF07701.1 cell division protein SepF [Desulfitobacterium metallireducens DSM 15288]